MANGYIPAAVERGCDPCSQVNVENKVYLGGVLGIDINGERQPISEGGIVDLTFIEEETREAAEQAIASAAAAAESEQTASEAAASARSSESAAQTAANAAEAAKADAEDAARSANSSKNTAESHASAAQAAAAAAQVADGNAERSAEIAIAAAAQAASSAGAAQQYANEAYISASTAQTASGAAQDAQTAAEASASTASSAATTATQAKDAAQAAQSAAEAAKAAAAQSATAAAGSATAAAQSAAAAQAAAMDVIDKAPIITDTASGAIASFPDGADEPIKQLTVGIEPQQDLHGYDNPWPAGGGKNKLNLDTDVTVLSGFVPPTVTITSEDGSATITENYYDRNANKFGWAFNVESNQDYVVSGNITTTNPVAMKIYATDGTVLYTYNLPSSIYTFSRSFNSGTNTTLYFYVSISSWGQTITLNNLQIELGSTATAYSPYSNICPITGWTGAEVVRTGKNLFATTGTGKTESGVTWTINADGSVTVSGTATGYTSLGVGVARVSPSMGAVKISGTNIGSNASTNIYFSDVRVRDINKQTVHTIVSSGSSASSFTVDLSQFSDAYDIAVTVKRNINVATNGTFMIQVEIGNTVTEWTPYAGTSYPITWQTEAGTVYGGNVRFNADGSVVLTANKKIVDLGDLTYTRSTSGLFTYNNFRDSLSSLAIGTAGDALSDVYIFMDSASITGTNPAYYYHFAINNGGVLYISDPRYATTSEFKEAMAGSKLIYALATPITYTLTAQQIKTLLGTNNIWADTGDVEVEYRADTKLYIDKKLAALLAALS